MFKFIVLKEEYEPSEKRSSSGNCEFHCTEWRQFTHPVTTYVLSTCYVIGAVSPGLDTEINLLS